MAALHGQIPVTTDPRILPKESEVGDRVQFGQHSSPRARNARARDLQSQILQNSEIGDFTYEL